MTRGYGLVLSGGVALGAYQAGAIEVLEAENDLQPVWIAASSVGAVNAALLTGGNGNDRIAPLRRFWRHDTDPPNPGTLNLVRHMQSWLSALQTRAVGSPGHFSPNLRALGGGTFKSLYDLGPLQQSLQALVDFRKLNTGAIRISVATTDIETGETVIFDTGKGHKIGVEHLLASCGLLPEFAPRPIEGRLLGDGGLSANAPLEAFFDQQAKETLDFIIVLDLFAPDGNRPASLEEALARKNDLMFANQTLRRLQVYQEHNLLRPVIYCSYRADIREAGPEKTFDFSRMTIGDRWRAGALDMKAALVLMRSQKPLQPLNVIRRNGAA